MIARLTLFRALAALGMAGLVAAEGFTIAMQGNADNYVAVVQESDRKMNTRHSPNNVIVMKEADVITPVMFEVTIKPKGGVAVVHQVCLPLPSCRYKRHPCPLKSGSQFKNDCPLDELIGQCQVQRSVIDNTGRIRGEVTAKQGGATIKQVLPYQPKDLQYVFRAKEGEASNYLNICGDDGKSGVIMVCDFMDGEKQASCKGF